MNRRAFLASLVATASGLLVPDEDVKRVYSFAREIVASPAKLEPATFDGIRFIVFGRAWRDPWRILAMSDERGIHLDTSAMPHGEGLEIRTQVAPPRWHGPSRLPQEA